MAGKAIFTAAAKVGKYFLEGSKVAGKTLIKGTKTAGKYAWKGTKFLGKELAETAVWMLGDSALKSLFGGDNEIGPEQVSGSDDDGRSDLDEGTSTKSPNGIDTSEEFSLSLPEDKSRLNDANNDFLLAQKLSDINSELMKSLDHAEDSIIESEVLSRSIDNHSLTDLIKSDNHLLRDIVYQVSLQNKHLMEKQRFALDISKLAIKQEEDRIKRINDAKRNFINESDKIRYSGGSGATSVSGRGVSGSTEGSIQPTEEPERDGTKNNGLQDLGLTLGANLVADGTMALAGVSAGPAVALTKIGYQFADEEARGLDKKLYGGTPITQSYLIESMMNPGGAPISATINRNERLKDYYSTGSTDLTPDDRLSNSHRKFAIDAANTYKTTREVSPLFDEDEFIEWCMHGNNPLTNHTISTDDINSWRRENLGPDSEGKWGISMNAKEKEIAVVDSYLGLKRRGKDLGINKDGDIYSEVSSSQVSPISVSNTNDSNIIVSPSSNSSSSTAIDTNNTHNYHTPKSDQSSVSSASNLNIIQTNENTSVVINNRDSKIVRL